ncbi:MAG: protein tyrosine phosphatase family protein [Pseudomonadota bacterium]|nr:MAG: protein tyrosine phosphatase family protein [Pseudomonadota bacterium]
MKRALVFGLSIAAVLAVVAYFLGPRLLYTADDQVPRNFVALDARLATAGQPSAAQLASLAEQGFGVIVNLSPAGSFGSIADEGERVRAAGMVYIGLPIQFDAPSRQDFETLRRALDLHADRKVLVHCQLNYRASAMVFLYRVVAQGIPPVAAFAEVEAVWTPNATWREFMNRILAEERIAYEVW